MCTPIAAQAGGSLIEQTAGLIAGQQKAKQQQKDANNRYNSVANAALENYRFNLGQIAIRGDQELAASSQQASDLVRQGEAAQGSLVANAAARGVSGNSVDALLNEYAAIEAASTNDVNRNYQYGVQARKDQAKSLFSETQQRLTEAAPTKVYGPSVLGYAAGLAGSGLNLYGKYLDKLPTK